MSLRDIDYGCGKEPPRNIRSDCGKEPPRNIRSDCDESGPYPDGIGGSTRGSSAQGAIAQARNTVDIQVDELLIAARRLQSLKDRLFGEDLYGETALPPSPPGQIGGLCTDLERLEAAVLYIRRLTDWIEERL